MTINLVSLLGPISLMKMASPLGDTAMSWGDMKDRTEVHLSITWDVFQSIVNPVVCAGADPAPFTPYNLPPLSTKMKWEGFTLYLYVCLIIELLDSWLEFSPKNFSLTHLNKLCQKSSQHQLHSWRKQFLQTGVGFEDQH